MRTRRRLLLGAAGGVMCQSAVLTGLALPSSLRARDLSDNPAAPSRPLDVPYVPTPIAVVDAMLELAKVARSDLLYDLGCGDGRIVIRAATNVGCRGVGVDLDPQRVREARENARKAGVTSLTRFEVGDVFEFDFSAATVVTMYLLPGINLRLRPRLLKELKPGTRIVSHDFDMGDWAPITTQRIERSRILLWTVPNS